MGISSVGIGSGLDVEKMIQGLVEYEKRPLIGLERSKAKIASRVSTYAMLQSKVTDLEDSAAALALNGHWSSLQINSSRPSAVTANIIGLAQPVSFNVSVQQLARGQSTATEYFSQGSSIGSGTLTLQMGAWSDNQEFTPKSNSQAVNISVDSQDSISSIASKINTANMGIVASVVKNDNGDERLILRSKQTGEQTGFRVQVQDNDGENEDSEGLSRLGFDLASDPLYGMANQSYQKAQDAKATVNGIDVTSADNQINGMIAGINITLNEVTVEGNAALISATLDKAKIVKGIEDFVNAYNAISEDLRIATRYDEDLKEAGILQGDSVAVGIRNRLRSLVGHRLPDQENNSLRSLSDIGLSVSKGGIMEIDRNKLESLMENNLSGVKNLFNANIGDNSGIASRVKTYAQGLKENDGLLTLRNNALDRETQTNYYLQSQVLDRADSLEQKLRRTYTALDVKMGALQALANYMDNQVAMWNNSFSQRRR